MVKLVNVKVGNDENESSSSCLPTELPQNTEPVKLKLRLVNENHSQIIPLAEDNYFSSSIKR